MPIVPERPRARTRARPAPSPDAADRAASIRAMDNLRRVVRALSASARSVSARGLSGAQLFVLRQIAAAPSLSLGELAERTLTGQSTVSEVVARLVERGLVARVASSADARRAELTLTPSGRRAIDRTDPTAQERLADGLAAMPRARRAALADALDEWLAAAGLGEVAVGMFFDGRPETAVRRTRAGRST
jgi:DNA-binding MarR family transcriptional regulator